MNMQYAEIDELLTKSMARYGTAQVIDYLRKIDDHIDCRNSDSYKKIFEIVLNHFDVSERDLKRPRITESVNARRVLCYMLNTYTKFDYKIICRVVGISELNFYRYVKYISDVMKDYHINKDLNESVKNIELKYHSDGNERN